MKQVVLDTDVVSFLFKNDTRSKLYLPYLENSQWLISFMTEAELEHRAVSASWSSKRTDWLRIFIKRLVIVPYSHALPLKWAGAMASVRKSGRRIEASDAWVAATSLLYGAPLLTHNKSDYLGVANLAFADR